MKMRAKWLALLLAAAVLAVNLPFVSVAANDVPVTILYTHDLHDNLLPFKMEHNGAVDYYGGYARLQTAIRQQREKDPDLLLVDAGDFSMGTLFQTIFSSHAPGLRMLGQMDYDVTTFGNHEFDFRPEGLAASLEAAVKSNDPLPRMVVGNISFPADEEGTINPDLKSLQEAMDAYGVQPYTILERKGYRIGVFGIVGEDSASNAPMAGVEFTDPVEQARQIVDKLGDQEKVDLIVCLSHSGTSADLDKSEDVILAREVPEIDVIISGHSHTKLEKPIQVGDTVICSTGEYGQNLGMLSLQRSGPGIWEQQDHQLISINSSIPGDAAINQRIIEFKSIVQKTYLDDLGMKFDGLLAATPFSFASMTDIARQHTEQPLGSLISDAYIYAVQQAEGAEYEPVDVAIVPNGTIRASFVRGDITVSDAFNASSLGIGADKKSGYPLISVYLTGKELKTACEVDASVTPLMGAAQLYMSGMTYTFNPHRLIFNKVTDAALLKPDGSRAEIEDDRLYRVAAGLYSAQMLSVVGSKSFGLLSIVPKTKDGQPITDFEAQIIHDASGREVKEWAALARYLQSFDSEEGVPQVPESYAHTHGRKVVNEDGSLGAIISHPNHIALAVYGIIAVLLLLVALIVRAVVRRRQRAAKPSQPI